MTNAERLHKIASLAAQLLNTGSARLTHDELWEALRTIYVVSINTENR